MKPNHLYQTLFWSTFVLSTFTFGGGYVIITLMQKKFVEELGWIEKEEMLDLVAIAQSAPGPIAVNGAIVIGYKLAGIRGILTCVVATVLPPFIIISILSVFYMAFKENPLISQMLSGMQAGVAAVIASVVFDMGTSIFKAKEGRKRGIIILTAAFAADFIFNVNVVIIILVCLVVGVGIALMERRFMR